MKAFLVVVLILILVLPAAGEYRTYDGTNNNLKHPEWGSTGIQLLRTEPDDYADGISEPAGKNRPSPRVISNIVIDQDGSMPNTFGRSDYIWLWGQFIDHDLDLTNNAVPPEPFDIVVPPGDPVFDPNDNGGVVIPLNRSEYEPNSIPRQQINALTAWLDASMVYGSDITRANWLRTFSGGRLKVTSSEYGDLLPYNDGTVPNGGGMGTNLFVAGEVRANENANLMAIHTLFVREHNRLANQISAACPSLTDEQIYQKARKIVGGEIQVITFKEFLPALLNGDEPNEYKGYNPKVNPGIANVFSTAAFRLGHSAISPEVLRIDENMQVIPDGNLGIVEAFFNPEAISEEGGIEPILRGLANQLHQEIDSFVIDELRNNLFSSSDLPSLNMQRGRDHGLPSYNALRGYWGLEMFMTFEDLNPDAEIVSALASVYGDVNNIDAWVGIITEYDNGGSLASGLMHTIIKNQFERIRNGDRFWYSIDPDLSSSEKAFICSVRLKDIIEMNTDITGLQDNVFYVPDGAVPDFDELTISSVKIIDGKYWWQNDTMYIEGSSLDATLENWKEADSINVAIYGDNNTTAVITKSIPLTKLTYLNGKLIYKGSAPLTEFQINILNKTFTIMASKINLNTIKTNAAIEIRLGTYFGKGTGIILK
ncbi:MAG: hypothetical protein A2Y10_04185 [Planctomycetes bacterium GWF2_41_51]|nr:MAG: hypothetical protein A2Y10_04185 [Planctomycetes bacterium GWF2_41_51]